MGQYPGERRAWGISQHRRDPDERWRRGGGGEQWDRASPSNSLPAPANWPAEAPSGPRCPGNQQELTGIGRALSSGSCVAKVS